MSAFSDRFDGDPTSRFAQASTVLAASLFSSDDRAIDGLAYAIGYRLSNDLCGGDIVDVFQFDNDSVAFSVADISGKGAEAAAHAALVKFGLRAYSSLGLTPEKTMRAMDRLYIENEYFARADSFASVFFGLIDRSRRVLTYANAGHEPVIAATPGEPARILGPTCPVIGVFDERHHLFRQTTLHVDPGSLLVAVTDGITESRSSHAELYGMERLLALVERHRDEEPDAIVKAVIDSAKGFGNGIWRDDAAVLVVRFVEHPVNDA